MLIFVFTGAHRYTHKQLPQWPGMPRHQVWSYERLLHKARLPMATYILGDFDRLSAWELELAARAARTLQAGGARVLNDPARSLQRYAMLRKLHAAGINRFQAWSLDHDGEPQRYPVFLRTASAHRGPLTELLHDAEAVRQAAEGLISQGVPRKELLAVEYMAEPVGAVFRKHGAFRVGERIVTTLSAHDKGWKAKIGVKGIAGDALYAEELAFIADGRYDEPVRRAFEIAEIEYGRADFGIVGGAIQIYEINTNPIMRKIKDHPNADRLASDRLWRARYAEALAAIDTQSGGTIAMDQPELKEQRRRDRWAFGHRFMV